MLTIPKRFAEIGDPHEGIDAAPGSLEKLLELAARDEAAGLGDAPWPPHFRKTESEPRRVAPSRAKSVANTPRTKMPLIVVANSPSKEAALSGLERWKRKHAEVAKLLAADDVLVDSMRGRSSTWTRIRINLRHVPKSYGLFMKLPILMTTQLANGARYARRRKVLERGGLRCLRQKWISARAAEQLQAARRCNRAASCRYATSGTAPYDGSACPAYARTRLPLPTRV